MQKQSKLSFKFKYLKVKTHLNGLTKNDRAYYFNNAKALREMLLPYSKKDGSQKASTAANKLRECRRCLKKTYNPSKEFYGTVEFNKITFEDSADTLYDLKLAIQSRIQNYRNNKRQLKVDDESIVGVKYNGVYNTPGLFARKFQTIKRDRLYIPKKPKTNVPHIGVEIECIVKVKEDKLVDMFVKAGLDQYVELHEDGSISTNDNSSDCENGCCECEEYCEWENCTCRCQSNKLLPIEVVVCAPETMIHRVIKQVCAVLHDAEVDVNSSCGLHVHLDQRNRDSSNTYTRLVKSLPLLCSMVPKKRLKSTYCHINEHEDIEDQRASSDRYLAVNPHALTKHNTIEVRLHSGTANYIKIVRWIDLLVFIIDHDTPLVNVKTLAGLQRFIGIIPHRLASYIASRIEKFNPTPKEDLSIDVKINRKINRTAQFYNDDELAA